MGSVSQDLFLSPLSISLSLHPTVTMFVLPRLTLFLSIIFLGLFCLPQTVTCQDDIPDPYCEVYTNDVWCELVKGAKLDRYCIQKDGGKCMAKCKGKKVVLEDCKS